MVDPATDSQLTNQIASHAAALVKSNRIRGSGEIKAWAKATGWPDLELALVFEALARTDDIRFIQAREAYELGLTTRVAAARYAHVRDRRISGDIPGSKA